MASQHNQAGLFIRSLKKDCDICANLSDIQDKLDLLLTTGEAGSGDTSDTGPKPPGELFPVVDGNRVMSYPMTYDRERGVHLAAAQELDPIPHGWDPTTDEVVGSNTEGSGIPVFENYKIKVLNGSLVQVDNLGNVLATIDGSYDSIANTYTPDVFFVGDNIFVWAPLSNANLACVITRIPHTMVKKFTLGLDLVKFNNSGATPSNSTVEILVEDDLILIRRNNGALFFENGDPAGGGGISFQALVNLREGQVVHSRVSAPLMPRFSGRVDVMVHLDHGVATPPVVAVARHSAQDTFFISGEFLYLYGIKDLPLARVSLNDLFDTGGVGYDNEGRLIFKPAVSDAVTTVLNQTVFSVYNTITLVVGDRLFIMQTTTGGHGSDKPFSATYEFDLVTEILSPITQVAGAPVLTYSHFQEPGMELPLGISCWMDVEKTTVSVRFPPFIISDPLVFWTDNNGDRKFARKKDLESLGAYPV